MTKYANLTIEYFILNFKYMGEFLSRLKERVAAERGAEGKERGKNTHVTFSFTRHEKPTKDPDSGMSMDQILPEGLDRAKATGTAEDNEYLLVMGSRKVKRARQTGQSYVEGVNETGLAEVINKEGAKGSKIAEFGIYAMSDLDPVQDAGKILKPILAEGKKLIADGKLEASDLEAWAINHYVKTPDADFEAAGVPTPRQTATELAHRLESGMNMSKRLFENLDTKVNNFTHGPKLECLLKYVLKKEDGSVGVQDLDEIGGSFKPGESMDFDIQRDEHGELKPLTVQFRGETYEVDMETLKQLQDEYKIAKNAEKEN